jgi:hypothetical protein
VAVTDECPDKHQLPKSRFANYKSIISQKATCGTRSRPLLGCTFYMPLSLLSSSSLLIVFLYMPLFLYIISKAKD